MAALAVVVFHLVGNTAYGEHFHFLASGVDLFFIISGFVIYKSSEREDRASAFLLKRAIRIFPPWWIALAVFIALSYAINGRTFGLDRIVTSTLLIFQFNNDLGYIAPIYHVGWTLSFEVLFYLTWGLLIFMGPALGIRHRLRPVLAALLLFALIAAVRVGQKIFGALPPDSGFLAFGDLHLLEFAGGAIFASVESRLRGLMTAPVAIALAIVGAALFAFGSLYAPSAPDPLKWGAPIFLVFAGAVCLEEHFKKRPVRWLAFFGDASYSLYLFHAMIIRFIVVDLLAIDVQTFLVPIFLVVVAACSLIHVYVENPLLALMRPMLKRRKAPPFSTAAN